MRIRLEIQPYATNTAELAPTIDNVCGWKLFAYLVPARWRYGLKSVFLSVNYYLFDFFFNFPKAIFHIMLAMKQDNFTALALGLAHCASLDFYEQYFRLVINSSQECSVISCVYSHWPQNPITSSRNLLRNLKIRRSLRVSRSWDENRPSNRLNQSIWFTSR